MCTEGYFHDTPLSKLLWLRTVRVGKTPHPLYACVAGAVAGAENRWAEWLRKMRDWEKRRIEEGKSVVGASLRHHHANSDKTTQTKGRRKLPKRGTTEERKALGGDSGPVTAVLGE